MVPMTPPIIRAVVETVAAIGTVGSLFFYFLSALGSTSFLRYRRKRVEQAARLDAALP